MHSRRSLILSRRAMFGRAATAVMAIALAGGGANASAQSRPETLRIGYQKSASLFVLQKAQGTLEKRLSALKVDVRWVEFPAGPQLLEGLNVGSVDVGYVGEAPPIFAQAAGANFVYLGNDPAAPEAEAIVVSKDSPLKRLIDLKGKKIALNRGSNVHYLLIRALEKAGLQYTDIQPVFLAPADARAAFEKGAVDAWAIWDPFLAAVEKQLGVRQLADGRGVAFNHAYYLGERQFVERRPDVIKALFDDSKEQGQWIKSHLRQAAAIIAPVQGLDAEVVEVALRRSQFGVAPVTETIVAEQQKIADAFYELKLIPKTIRIADAVKPAPKVAAQ